MHLTNKKGGIYMKKEENKVDFDLSVLKLEELIKVYEEIDNFINVLNNGSEIPSHIFIYDA